MSRGKFGPDGFCQVIDPGSRFQGGSGRAERRKETRFPIPEDLVLEVRDESHDSISTEATVTTNISLGGAVVFTQFDSELGSFVRVKSKRHDVELLAIVRGRREGPGDSSRLIIEFVDRIFPLEGIGERNFDVISMLGFKLPIWPENKNPNETVRNKQLRDRRRPSAAFASGKHLMS
ncbi:MAG: PilZ domain-containing protein [Pyrinomonadaceae bacterium]|nr:PilZ domain-containing protein [Chloracidobacterium sp.]MBL0240596.1 PilZ domain-containing protein [Chloracidobacterium sp.]MBP9934618.1 PilZ domain-containing protein [Pyrinomonadaceae bacterium]